MNQKFFMLTLLVLLPLKAGAEPVSGEPPQPMSVQYLASKPSMGSAPEFYHARRKFKESSRLLAERPSVAVSADEKTAKPATTAPQFIDAPPQFWTDCGDSWRCSPSAAATTES